MQNSNAVVKKIYCVVVNGEVQEKLDNVPNKYRYHYKGDLPECGLKIK